MRSLVLALAALLAGCALVRTPAPAANIPTPSTVDLAVITWNMHAGHGDLPRLLNDLTSGRLTGSVPSQYVVMLQEAIDREGDPPSTLAKARGFGSGMYFVPVRDVGGRVRGNALLASAPLNDRGVVQLPRERQPRSAATAHIYVNGVRLLVASVHLENRVSWWRGGLLSDSARGKQAAALVAALPGDEHGVVGGDLNTWLGPDEPALVTLLARFRDTPPATRGEVSFHNHLLLDHLLFDLPEGWTATRRVLSDAYGSDHLPVLGTVTQVSRQLE